MTCGYMPAALRAPMSSFGSAKGQSCSAETLVDAATLAAHFSDLRGETIVDVLYTPRRFVHKRKGSPVGSVTLGSEKVIAARIEAGRVERAPRKRTESSS